MGYREPAAGPVVRECAMVFGGHNVNFRSAFLVTVLEKYGKWGVVVSGKVEQRLPRGRIRSTNGPLARRNLRKREYGGRELWGGGRVQRG